MDTTTTSPIALAPSELIARVEGGRPPTILDVRADATWRIEGPGLAVRHVPAKVACDDVAALARGLEGEVAVVCNRGLTAESVASALRASGVDARVLEGGMRGWIGALVAHPVSHGIPGLEILQIQRPARGCLSYLLAAAGRAAVVDPAPDAGFYLTLAADLGTRITDVVDTHLHADHLSGARELARRTGARLRLPAGALDRGVTYDVTPLRDGEVIDLGGIPLRAIALPGHTSDMTGLVVAEQALIAGDSLFAHGVARPDLQYGDAAGARAMGRLLFATLHERVLALADDVVLLPGHESPGIRTTAVAPALGEVRASVPELAIEPADAFADELLSDIPARPSNFEAVIEVNAGRRDFDPELESGGNSCSTR